MLTRNLANNFGDGTRPSPRKHGQRRHNWPTWVSRDRGGGLTYTTIDTADGPINQPSSGLPAAAIGPAPPTRPRPPTEPRPDSLPRPNRLSHTPVVGHGKWFWRTFRDAGRVVVVLSGLWMVSAVVGFCFRICRRW